MIRIIIAILRTEASTSTIHHQFWDLEEKTQQQVLDLFVDEDVYKMLETPTLRDNQSFQQFIQTITLDEFEVLMKVIQVLKNFGVFYDKDCLLFSKLFF